MQARNRGKERAGVCHSHKSRQTPVIFLAHADVGPSCSRLERMRTGPPARTSDARAQPTWFPMVLGVGREWATNSARDDREARLCRAWVTGSLPCPAVARTHTHAAPRTAHAGSLCANSPRIGDAHVPTCTRARAHSPHTPTPTPTHTHTRRQTRMSAKGPLSQG